MHQTLTETLKKQLTCMYEGHRIQLVPSERKTPIGLRLEPEVMAVLTKAAQAAGVSKTKIIEECVSRYASMFVEESLEERKKLFADYLRSSELHKKKRSPRG